MTLIVEPFIFNAPPSLDGNPTLKMAAKRYIDGRGSVEGVTLLLAHGAGTHKEHWEPVLQNLFDAQSNKIGTRRIREAWAFDWQTHGDSAVLNRNALQAKPRYISISEWALALVAFVNSKYAVHHRLVVIGHSSGASAWMYSTKFFPFRIPYLAMILVEPNLVDSDCLHNQHGNVHLGHRVSSGRDSWPSKEEAFNYFRKRALWNTWDIRVLSIYVDSGIHLEQQPDGRYSRVVLKCDKSSEDACYTDFESTFDATEQIAKVCRNVPIHVIFGEINDVIPRHTHDLALDPSTGRRVASVARIPRAGHMVLQQQPNALARHIASLLDGSTTDSAARLHL